MTDAHAEHPPVSFQARPDHPLPPLVPEPKAVRGRRSTAVRSLHPRRGRWLTVFGFAAVIAVLGVVSLAVEHSWIFALACLMFAVVTCTTQYLAEVDIALSRVRADAEKRARHAAERDLRSVSETYDKAHAIIRGYWPSTADDLSQALALDLRRSHTLSHRLESDSR